jgi:ABC-2 type transport system permease protein
MTVLERQAPVAEPPLAEVHGPSALGGGWRRFAHLTWLIGITDWKLAYFDSVLGYLWSLMRPILFFGVLYVMFDIVLNLSKGIPDFPVLLLMNVVFITFFQEGTNQSVPSLVIRENLVRKMNFARLVIPLSTVLTAMINFALNLIVVIGFMLIYGVSPRLTWLLLPVALIPLVVFTTGLSMLLSALYVRYRDVAPIWGVIGQILFYASPIFYTVDRVAEHSSTLARYYLFNPLAAVMQEARHWMVGGSPGLSYWMGGHIWVLVPFAIVVLMFVLGLFTFARMAPQIAEEL